MPSLSFRAWRLFLDPSPGQLDPARTDTFFEPAVLSQVNHYEVLGVAGDATLSEIRIAYRRAAQLCHPDRNGGNPAAEARFKSLGAAYRILRHPTLRQAFDQEIGLGSGWKPWYGPRVAAEREDEQQADSLEGYERLAVRLATSNRWNAPRIAARLARSGCPYRTAWQIAWRIRYQVLNDRLDEMVDREIRDPNWGQPAAPRYAHSRPSATTPGASHVGPSRYVKLSESRSLQAVGAERQQTAARASNALAEYRPTMWTTRIRRLRQILLGIARLIGFEPPRMSREHRKMLRIEYQQRAGHQEPQRLLGRDPRLSRGR